MTLIAGGMLQWTGSYVPLFAVAGLMHPVAFGAILLFGGRKLEPADIGAGASAARSPVLLRAGGIMTVAGLGLAALVLAKWASILEATRSASAAAQGLTACVGLALLGLALLYAGRGRERAA
jgi:hypothetical protein